LLLPRVQQFSLIGNPTADVVLALRSNNNMVRPHHRTVNTPDALSLADLHDAILESIAADWATASAVAHLRAVGPEGGRPVTLTWSGVTELQMSRMQPWGPGAAVLEVRAADGMTEVVLQSGDTLLVRATRFNVRGDGAVALRYAELGVDMLCDAGLLARRDFDQATALVAQEISVRRCMGDI
jgi:hypothetical protein